MNIYIGNMSSRTCRNVLKDIFSEYGMVQQVKVIKDHVTRHSKGYGFVEMANNDEAELAINALNGKLVDGRNIKVDAAIKADKNESAIF